MEGQAPPSEPATALEAATAAASTAVARHCRSRAQCAADARRSARAVIFIAFGCLPLLNPLSSGTSCSIGRDAGARVLADEHKRGKEIAPKVTMRQRFPFGFFSNGSTRSGSEPRPRHPLGQRVARRHPQRSPVTEIWCIHVENEPSIGKPRPAHCPRKAVDLGFIHFGRQRFSIETQRCLVDLLNRNGRRRAESSIRPAAPPSKDHTMKSAGQREPRDPFFLSAGTTWPAAETQG